MGEIKWNAEQLSAIDTMGTILTDQMVPSLKSAVEDIAELKIQQCNFLENFTKSSLWFNKEQRQRLNAMSRTMNKVPGYRRKLASIQRKMKSVSWNVEQMKRDTAAMKQELGL